MSMFCHDHTICGEGTNLSRQWCNQAMSYFIHFPTVTENHRFSDTVHVQFDPLATPELYMFLFTTLFCEGVSDWGGDNFMLPQIDETPQTILKVVYIRLNSGFYDLNK